MHADENLYLCENNFCNGGIAGADPGFQVRDIYISYI
jgi:hypothetical protein